MAARKSYATHVLRWRGNEERRALVKLSTLPRASRQWSSSGRPSGAAKARESALTAAIEAAETVSLTRARALRSLQNATERSNVETLESVFDAAEQVGLADVDIMSAKTALRDVWRRAVLHGTLEAIQNRLVVPLQEAIEEVQLLNFCRLPSEAETLRHSRLRLSKGWRLAWRKRISSLPDVHWSMRWTALAGCSRRRGGGGKKLWCLG